MKFSYKVILVGLILLSLIHIENSERILIKQIYLQILKSQILPKNVYKTTKYQKFNQQISDRQLRESLTNNKLIKYNYYYFMKTIFVFFSFFLLIEQILGGYITNIVTNSSYSTATISKDYQTLVLKGVNSHIIQIHRYNGNSMVLNQTFSGCSNSYIQNPTINRNGSFLYDICDGQIQIYQEQNKQFNKIQTISVNSSEFGDISSDANTLAISGKNNQLLFIFKYNSSTAQYELKQTVNIGYNALRVTISADAGYVGICYYQIHCGLYIFNGNNYVFNQIFNDTQETAYVLKIWDDNSFITVNKVTTVDVYSKNGLNFNLKQSITHSNNNEKAFQLDIYNSLSLAILNGFNIALYKISNSLFTNYQNIPMDSQYQNTISTSASGQVIVVSNFTGVIAYFNCPNGCQCTWFTCTSCKSGYTRLNNSCTPNCNIQNCYKCSFSQVCSICSQSYQLSNNSCKKSNNMGLFFLCILVINLFGSILFLCDCCDLMKLNSAIRQYERRSRRIMPLNFQPKVMKEGRQSVDEFSLD